MWFCFSRILQNDLDKVKEHWNSHKVSKSPYSGVHGVPDIMYFLPEHHGNDICLVDVSQEQVDKIEDHCELQELEDNIYREYSGGTRHQLWGGGGGGQLKGKPILFFLGGGN